MIRVIASVATVLVALSAPAMAAPFCTDDSIGLVVAFGENYTDKDRETFDEMNLRQLGYDVTRVERWNGCIRAWVRVDGREEMQFFQPGSYRPVN